MTHSRRQPTPNPFCQPTAYMLGFYVPQEIFLQDTEQVASTDCKRAEVSESSWASLLIIGVLVALSGIVFTYGATHFSKTWGTGVESLVSQQEIQN